MKIEITHQDWYRVIKLSYSVFNILPEFIAGHCHTRTAQAAYLMKVASKIKTHNPVIFIATGEQAYQISYLARKIPIDSDMVGVCNIEN